MKQKDRFERKIPFLRPFIQGERERKKSLFTRKEYRADAAIYRNYR